MKQLYACCIKSCAVIICVFFRPLISYGTAVNILWIIIQEKNSPKKKKMLVFSKKVTLSGTSHIWKETKGGSEAVAKCGMKILREVSVPFLMPHRADFQNCMF